MDSFPDLVLVKIFSHLDAKGLLAARDVCCRWRDLTEIESVWRDIKVELDLWDFSDFRDIRKSVVYRCIKVAPVLLSLKLKTIDERQLSKLDEIIRLHPPKIRRLELESLSIDNFSKIFSWLSDDLEELYLCDGLCSYPSYVYLPKLTHLAVHAESSKLIANNFRLPKLQELILYRTDLSSHYERNLVLNMKATLKKLYVKNVMYSNKGVPTLFFNFQNMLKHGFRELQEFRIYDRPCIILIWKVNNLDLELPVQPNYAERSESTNHALSCGNCNLYDTVLQSSQFESISNLTVSFKVGNVACVSNFLRSPSAALKLNKKLTLQECCSRYHPDQCKDSGSVGFKLVSEVVKHIPGIQILCVKGCSKFMKFSWEYFVGQHRHIKFDFQELSSFLCDHLYDSWDSWNEHDYYSAGW